ncbi:MAG: DNA modification methylase [Planctomycetes bacterium]|nr:DNA modification methylase [Planctomycetota bacterium]
MELNALAVEWVAIDSLFLNPSNPRLNDPAVPHVAASLKRFGWQQPVVAKPSGEVIAGNTRLKAAKSLGIAEVPVVRFTGTDLDATAYSIADNKTHEFALWDEPALAKLLEELRAEDSLEGVGYSSVEIDELLAELDALTPRVVEDDGPEPPPINPVARLGDLWVLGDHKLLCGDSTSAADIARLMAGEKAALLSTDSPYAVDYDGMNRPGHDGKPSGKDWSALYHETDIKDLGVFLDAFYTACLPHVAEDAAMYLWFAHVQHPAIAATWEKHDLLFHQVIVWHKPCATFGHSYYRWKHEPCAFGWRRGHKPEHGTAQLETVWMADWDGKARITTFHPTSKPTRLFEIPMEQHTARGALVLEPFNGSGSQLIAAEKLGRRCRAIEIQPAFVDGTIARWEKATGKQATLDGKAFVDVKLERGVA